MMGISFSMFSFSFQVVVTTDTPFRAIILPQRNWASKEYALFCSLSLQFMETAMMLGNVPKNRFPKPYVPCVFRTLLLSIVA
jgi:hypothetical protein